MSLPHPHPLPPADAFILAGGQSRRMGHDKALTLLAGVPLVQRACDLLRAAGLEPRIAGAQSDLSSFAPTLPDDPTQSSRGPLSGICSALANTSAPFSLSPRRSAAPSREPYRLSSSPRDRHPIRRHRRLHCRICSDFSGHHRYRRAPLAPIEPQFQRP